VEPVTADDLKRLGAPYQTGDLTGHGNGLEASFERQLAGSPSGEVRLAGRDGAAAKVLHRFPGEEGRPVRTTLDPRAQRAGERALAGVGKPAALVAVRPSTGELLAVVNAPAEYNRALLGRYPPGSTFKVVTAAALLDGGLRPSDPVDCPKETDVGGRRFGNFEDEVLGRVPFSSAFAHSCNTAFVRLAAQRLDGEELGAAAGRFGFGVEPAPGVPAVTSRVPPPADQADLGAEGFGQGRITASPLQMAMVAATAAEGQWRSPRLVDGQDGAGDGGQAPGALDRGVADTLRRLMRLVVTEGTARSAGLPAGTAGKTGTAEFGSGDPLPTHAWFIGFRGDLAFALVVEDGGVGGRVAAPLAARFLRALP
jgi:cell division protein FtsI/penicillin-binding protein 2